MLYTQFSLKLSINIASVDKIGHFIISYVLTSNYVYSSHSQCITVYLLYSLPYGWWCIQWSTLATSQSSIQTLHHAYSIGLWLETQGLQWYKEYLLFLDREYHHLCSIQYWYVNWIPWTPVVQLYAIPWWWCGLSAGLSTGWAAMVFYTCSSNSSQRFVLHSFRTSLNWLLSSKHCVCYVLVVNWFVVLELGVVLLRWWWRSSSSNKSFTQRS